MGSEENRKNHRYPEIGRVIAPELCALPGILDNISFDGCKIHFPVSVGQFLQLSAASISLFQQYALHSHASLGQLVQFSLASAFQSQHHVSVQSSIHFSHKSSGHESHVSPMLY